MFINESHEQSPKIDGNSQKEVCLFGAHRLSRLANLYLTNGTGTQRGETLGKFVGGSICNSII